ncbi:MAG: chemotaxis protein CheW [Deltaproteobacteria bacterium]|nr:chemotaxis protein CheW [Deltaproteobacteria bacterium]MBW2077969.1 chemotaxis protein CheW [Deltaproteobacteria bacterium]
MEWFAFKAADKYLGIEAQYIHRVVDEVKVTPVPLVPHCHMGVMYYRGEVFDVIHIGSLLGQREALYPPTSPEPASGGRWRAGLENSRIILMKWPSKKLALLPDKIIGLIWVEDNKREQTVYAPRSPRMSAIDAGQARPPRKPARLPSRARRPGRERCGREEECTVRLITPEHIWKKVSELHYGPHKV